MEGTSTFVQIDPPRTSGWRGAGVAVVGSLEGAAGAIPLSLGCATLVFTRVSPGLVASGVLATMVALVLIHLTTAASRRPIFFTGRILEATTLAAMLDQVVAQLPAWGLPDTTGVRLAFLCIIGAGAGLGVCLLYLLRADRLTPFIPAPVFAGFSNSIAVALILSQSRSLLQLAGDMAAAAVVGTIALAAFAAAFALRRWAPRRPAAAAGLVIGLLAGLAWWLAGHPAAVVSGGGAAMQLPVALADFRALAAPGVRADSVLLLVLGNSAILATIIFINTALSAQAMTQVDGLRTRRTRDGVVAGLSIAAAGAVGSAPLSGSILVCLAVARTSVVRWPTLVLTAMVMGAVGLTGVLGWVPLAAVIGVLLCEAWFMVDRASVQLLRDWLRGRNLPGTAREDLVLIVAVTALAVIANMVVAAFAGLVFGLFLLAVRSARQPVRHVWNGKQLSSNCARASSELRVLADHGASIRVFELEGDMFFAVAPSLERALETGTQGAACAVLDWSRIRYIDSSVAATVAAFQRQAAERGLVVVHAGAGMQAGNVAEELTRRVPDLRLAADLDFALETVENHLIQRHRAAPATDASTLLEAAHLFRNMSAEEMGAVQQLMTQKLYRAGETILEAGATGHELMLILQGSASVIVRDAKGQDVRVAGVRRGAIIGEVGFLDGSPRSASVVAQDDVIVALLTRDDYQMLCVTRQELAPKLVANIAVQLAMRLRHANRLALARSRAH